MEDRNVPSTADARHDFYMRKAAEAAQHAPATADSSMRASWERIAESWCDLAKQAVRTARIWSSDLQRRTSPECDSLGVDEGAPARDNSQMRTGCKLAAVHLALVAMLLRALLPAGWMPAVLTPANASPFVICTIDGPLHPAKHDPSSGQGRMNTPCVFAAAAHLSPPLADAPLLLPQFVQPIRFAQSHDDIIASASFRPNTARAPPASI